MTSVKIAASLPADQFAALEKARRQLGLKRSAVVQEALALWLAARQEGEAAARYVEGYLSVAEDAAVGDALVTAWADGVTAEDW